MMITIHGLAPNIKYQDVKILIKQECNIDDFILDNLVADTDGTRKIRIGLADDSEGYKLMKCLNGYWMPGNYVLKLVPIGKTTVNPNIPPSSNYDSRPGFQNQAQHEYQNQQRSDYPNQSGDYNRGPLISNPVRGPIGPHGGGKPAIEPNRNQPYGPGGNHAPAAMDPVRRPPWAGNSNSPAHWGANPPMGAQIPQTTFNFGSGHQQGAPSHFTQQQPDHTQPSRSDMRPFDQGRHGPPEQTYTGYPAKNIAPQPGHPPQSRSEMRPFDQGRQGPPEQPYRGYPAKKMGPAPAEVRQNLRNIDTDGGNPAPAPTHGGRYPANQFQQEKPVTIMKSNFQGPTQYNISHPEGHHPQYPAKPSHWTQGGSQHQQQKPHFSKSSPIRAVTFEDKKYPQDQAREPRGIQPKPDTYKEYEKRRGFPEREAVLRRSSPSRREEMPREPGRMSDVGPRRPSPTGRIGVGPRRPSPSGRMSDMGPRRPSPSGRMGDVPPRRPSPSGRMGDVQRRVSPPMRRDEPLGRRYSPSRKRSPPVERHAIPGNPGALQPSPHKRASPSRTLVSPRRDERPPRFSPGRHHSDKMNDKYGQDVKDLKKVRPAYDPMQSHAPNQAMYSDGYRPSERGNVHYPVTNKRQGHQGPWQRERDEPASMIKQHDVTQDKRMQMTRERTSKQVEKQYPEDHKSRPYSFSPPRSWLNEKRRSPDAPPPPVWPGQNNDYQRPSRIIFTEKEEKPKHTPVWESRPFKEDDLRNRRPDDRKPYDEVKMRSSKDLAERGVIPQSAIHDRYQREPKFSLHDEHDERRGNYPRRETPDRKSLKDDFDLQRRTRENCGPDEYNPRRESPLRGRKPELPKDTDKGIYNRPLQFKKKAEEMRKSGSRKREEFDDDRRHSDKNPEYMRQLYEDRARYRDEETPRMMEREERGDEIPRDDRMRDAIYREERLRKGGLRGEMIGEKRHSHGYDYRQNIQKNERGNIVESNAREKRQRAIDDIAEKILGRSEEFKHLQGGQRQRILEELKLVVSRQVYDMFGNSDVSFKEIIIKYQDKHNVKDEAKILLDVMQSMPKQFRAVKRHAAEPSDLPAKTSRHSPSADLKQGKRAVPPQAVKAKPPHSNIKQRLGVRPEQRVLKPQPKPTASAVRPVQEQKKKVQAEVKAVKPVTPSDKECRGDYELNALMTRMVAVELKDLMAKITQELPDNPRDEMERVVVDILKNKTVPCLSNVLGLNVTKRLLNVYNPLLIKVKFNGKPQKEELREFIKKYNFTAFARKAVNIFAARVRSIDDFDRICGDSNVRCGSVKVTVNPVYRFTQCPPNLNTNYKDDIETEFQNSDVEMTDVANEIVEVKNVNIEAPKDIVTQTKPVDKNITTVNNVMKTEPSESKVDTTIKSVTKITPQESNIIASQTKSSTKLIPQNSTNTVTPNTTTTKVTPQKSTNTIAQNTTSTEVIAQNTTNTITPNTTATKVVPQKETNTVNPNTIDTKVATQKSTNTVTPNTTATKVTPQKSTNTATTKATPTKVTPQKSTNTATTKVAPTKVTLQKSTKFPPKKQKPEDDYDELDDHDILALMSEGIVLDECSGSDEE